MKVLRLAWSGYQDEKSLAREREAFNRLGVDYHRPSTPGKLTGEPGRFQIIIINSQFTVDEEFIAGLQPGSLVITASSGYDHIDLDTCRQCEIRVARTPRARARKVVEHTEMFVRALLRDLPGSCFSLKRGNWTRNNTAKQIRHPGNERAGIIGYGVIGRRCARRFSDIFSSPLLVADPVNEKQIEQDRRLEYCFLEEIVEKATVLTIHADLNDSTAKLFTENVFRKMPDSALLINTARGEMIELEDLGRALETKEIAGAALDVFSEEPPENNINFLENNRLLVTPHSAGFGPELLNELREELINTANAFLNGDKLPHEVKPYSKSQLEKLNFRAEKLKK